MNALINALGGQEISLPATAEKVWRALKENKNQTLSSIKKNNEDI